MSAALIFGSQEYLKVTITGDVELDAQPVYFAVIAASAVHPEDTDWVEAEWTGVKGLSRVARLLLGEDGYAIEPGEYQVFAKVIDNPEEPVMAAGYLTIS